jgi:CRP-like cAMP-binding protein
MRDGRYVETSTVGQESGVALLDAVTGEAVQSRVFAQIGGGAIRLDAVALRRRLAHSPVLLGLFMRHARANGLQSEQNVACNATHDIEQRLAKWLLMTADRVGSDRFMLTQDYMAVMTGSQRTTVSAAATRLKAARMVAYTRGQVTILDRAGLSARACECYAHVRGLFENLRVVGDS